MRNVSTLHFSIVSCIHSRQVIYLKNYFFIFLFIFSANEICGQQSLYVASAGNMYTHTGAQMGIFGDIINDATGGLNHNNAGDVYVFRSAATGTGNSRIYDGPSAPSFTGNYNTGGAYTRFYNLVTDNSIGTNTASGTAINSTSGAGQIQVEQEVRISNQHTFTNGMIWTPRGSWKHAYVHYDANGATYTGSSNARHIDGYAAKTGSSNFDFPIGDGVRLRVSGLSSPASGTYKSAYFNKNPQSGTTGLSGSSAAASPMTGNLVRISSKEFWDIDGTAASQYKLTALNTVAGYSDWATDFVTFAPADMAIASWDNIWENLSLYTTPATLSVGGPFITAASATNPDNGNSNGTGSPFSAYTWGVTVYGIPLSVKLIDFKAIANGCAASLAWKTSNEEKADRFEIEQSNNGRIFNKVAVINAKRQSSENIYTATINQTEPINYYRLKMIEKDGLFNYSPVQQVKINCTVNDNYFNVYPNPVTNGETFLNFKVQYAGLAYVQIINTAGQQVMKNAITVNAASNIVPLQLHAFSKGIYIIHLLSADGTSISATQKIILE